MSVVINTNTAASIASNNLSASTAMLQKSLMRLSSGSKITNASDDAGGVAVAARLSSASKRASVATGNISNAIAFLQQQDSSLKTGTKMMQRMNELQALYRDTTKSVEDKDLYAVEFDSLKAEFKNAIVDATYNGKDLLASGAALAITIDDTGNQYTLNDPTNYVEDSSSYSIVGGGNYAVVNATGGNTAGTAGGALVLAAGTTSSATSVTITLAANDTLSSIVSKINNSTTAIAITASVSAAGKLVLTAKNEDEDIYVKAGTVDSISTALGLTESDGTAAASASAQVDDTLAAITNLAEARARNGSDQSVLGYYSELATATRTNYDSAVSRIMDVDVAEESTQLARYNTLVQAGTAMIAQANGSTQSALSLLK